ncbi:hypothetical protein HWV62_35626 [Athelia sp. TMB]|nr:hypothetical protein HWV62_35626 [Athelia sp. TMB]
MQTIVGEEARTVGKVAKLKGRGVKILWRATLEVRPVSPLPRRSGATPSTTPSATRTAMGTRARASTSLAARSRTKTARPCPRRPLPQLRARDSRLLTPSGPAEENTPALRRRFWGSCRPSHRPTPSDWEHGDVRMGRAALAQGRRHGPLGAGGTDGALGKMRGERGVAGKSDLSGRAVASGRDWARWRARAKPAIDGEVVDGGERVAQRSPPRDGDGEGGESGDESYSEDLEMP